MGQKIHPFSLRLGIIKDWKSRWFDLKTFPVYLREDYIIRKLLEKKLDKMGLESVEIERVSGVISIIIKTSRPGLIIGRGGGGVEDLKKMLVKALNKTRKEILTSPSATNRHKEAAAKHPELKIQIEEIKKPESQPKIIANNIAEQLEKRIPFRRVVKQSLEKVMSQKEVEGVKIKVSGRLDGSEIARDEKFHKGKIPLATLRANIDYAQATAFCTYGTVGIKVWIYKGEVFNKS